MNTNTRGTLIAVCGILFLTLTLTVPVAVNATYIPARQAQELFADNDPYVPDGKQPNSAYSGRGSSVLESGTGARSGHAVHERVPEIDRNADRVTVRDAARVDNWFVRIMRLLQSLRLRGVIR